MKKLIIAVLCLGFMMIGCMPQNIPPGNPERFDNAFFTYCPEGYKFQWKNGYCYDGDCETECVREDKVNPCYQVEDHVWQADDRYACCPEEFPCSD